MSKDIIERAMKSVEDALRLLSRMDLRKTLPPETLGVSIMILIVYAMGIVSAAMWR